MHEDESQSIKWIYHLNLSLSQLRWFSNRFEMEQKWCLFLVLLLIFHSLFLFFSVSYVCSVKPVTRYRIKLNKTKKKKHVYRRITKTVDDFTPKTLLLFFCCSIDYFLIFFFRSNKNHFFSIICFFCLHHFKTSLKIQFLFLRFRFVIKNSIQ